MICKSYEAARKQAHDNAAYTTNSWAAFIDTSGNARCERIAEGWTLNGVDCEIYDPPAETALPTTPIYRAAKMALEALYNAPMVGDVYDEQHHQTHLRAIAARVELRTALGLPII